MAEFNRSGQGNRNGPRKEGGNRSGPRREGGNQGGFGSRPGGFGSNQGGFGPREMHKAVCSECNQECEVPFKPTSGKPVFCKECYRNKKTY